MFKIKKVKKKFLLHNPFQFSVFVLFKYCFKKKKKNLILVLILTKNRFLQSNTLSQGQFFTQIFCM